VPSCDHGVAIGPTLGDKIRIRFPETSEGSALPLAGSPSTHCILARASHCRIEVRHAYVRACRTWIATYPYPYIKITVTAGACLCWAPRPFRYRNARKKYAILFVPVRRVAELALPRVLVGDPKSPIWLANLRAVSLPPRSRPACSSTPWTLNPNPWNRNRKHQNPLIPFP